MDELLRYFPELSDTQRHQFKMLEALYEGWNAKINVISRKDIQNLYVRHILHSLSIAKIIQFTDGSEILDLGTGGGFPGIPLAILFPNCSFHLVDSINKKIKVVQEIAHEIQLQNVTATACRAENVNGNYDFIVTRAVAIMPTLVDWTFKKLKKNQANPLSNGIIALKGSNHAKEESDILGKKYNYRIYPIKEMFDEPFFETKCVIHLSSEK